MRISDWSSDVCSSDLGYLDELLFANVRSIGMRGSVDWAVTLDRFRSQAMSIGLPLGGVLAVAAAASLRGQGPGLRDRRIIFVLGWLAAALVAFLSVDRKSTRMNSSH